MCLVAAKFNERPQACRLDDGFLQIESGWWIKIQRVRFGIQKPFTGRVQFLEDVFDKTDFFMRRSAAIVLPATFKFHLMWCPCR